MADREKRRYGTTGCEVEDCDRPHRARGMCGSHYKLARKYGTPTPRRRAEVVDGKRICARCKTDRPLSEWGAAKWCSACNRANALKYVTYADTWEAVCETCDDTFAATKRRRYSCSAECTRKRNNRENSKHVLRRRAALRDADVEVIRPKDIFERDGWICGICREPVRRDVRAPSPAAPSVDHIIPLVLGGAHTFENVQTAHLGCNSRKGGRLLEEVI